MLVILHCFEISSANLGQLFRGIALGFSMSTSSFSAKFSQLIENPARISQTNAKICSPLHAIQTYFLPFPARFSACLVEAGGGQGSRKRPHPPRFGGRWQGWVSAICITGVGQRRRRGCRGCRSRLDALTIFGFSRVYHSTRSLHARQLLIVLRQFEGVLK